MKNGSSVSGTATLYKEDFEKEEHLMQAQRHSTLLELVNTLSSFIDNDQEVVALVTYLVNSGRVRLRGTFAGATIALSPPYPPTPHPRRLLS
jgi:hypothetical protein